MGLQVVTWVYRWLHGVTLSYIRLQAVTGDYKGLKRIARGYTGYMRLQGLLGVGEGYRGFQGVT